MITSPPILLLKLNSRSYQNLHQQEELRICHSALTSRVRAWTPVRVTTHRNFNIRNLNWRASCKRRKNSAAFSQGSPPRMWEVSLPTSAMLNFKIYRDPPVYHLVLYRIRIRYSSSISRNSSIMLIPFLRAQRIWWQQLILPDPTIPTLETSSFATLVTLS
jgi:hypothetical protein